ncbi:ATP-grasp fold amidoligase family protein [Colwellia sp. BRX8-9]|uniref:ATP-grasp fold amidoligase family protein n=1 Tax=Colwellia sp. BRX8-9 TaxID=2759831 RepID=UPI0015F57BF0|nr:ATP-grasp fold amidoligase family protein [Colwellia sp. BRX8-9]MBA6349454.1 hypothetical protein [Colwellia sp. BRX8-9]
MIESTLRFILNNVVAPVVNIITYPFIERKWKQDCKKLPLTQEHKELYLIIHQHTARKLFKFPDLVNCQDFNDKIQWLKLFDQDELQIKCSDKLKVRDYVEEKAGTKYLVPMFQAVKSFDEINFDELPESFVMKTNHDSGTVVLVKNKANLDKKKAKMELEASLNRKFGRSVGEWAYSFIPPRIIIEHYIEPNNSAPPADYKFYCVNGEVKFCHYIYDRGNNSKEQLLSENGDDLKTPLHEKFELGTDFVIPPNWNEMLEVAKKVSAEFKCVRVDIFSSQGSIFVGEMTFWPMAGTYRGEGQKFFGTYLDFDRSTYKKSVL